MITFGDLSLGWGRGPKVVDRFRLEVPEGRILTVLGPSGCGKTTLLKAVAGLIGPDTPGLDWEGTLSGLVPDQTAVIFQNLGLLPWKTVEQNVELPLKWRGEPDRRTRVTEALAEFGLTDHARKWPAQLSGGLAQRTAIARALVLRPAVLLMDEPFSALDALTREKAQHTLWQLWQAHSPTVMLVTHSVDEAAALGHRCAVLTGTLPGRLSGVFDLGWTDEAPGDRRLESRFHDQTRALRAALEAGE